MALHPQVRRVLDAHPPPGFPSAPSADRLATLLALQGGTERARQPVAEGLVEPASRPVAEPPVAERLVGPASPPVAEPPAAEPPFVEPVAEPVAEPVTEPVAEAPRLAVPGPGGELPARIYRPGRERPDSSLPLLVHFHGGGLLPGELDLVDRPCRALAEATGAVVASVRCRTEEPYPCAVHDGVAATAWLAEHAADLGADPARVGVAGSGDGALVAAVVAQQASGEDGPVLALQLLLHPVTDFARPWPSRSEPAVPGALIGVPDLQRFTERYLHGADDPASPRVSPLRAGELSGLPAAVVVSAGFDPVRDEARAYADALTRAGVPVLDCREDTMVHGFCWLAGSVEPAAEVLARIGEYARGVFATALCAPQ